MPTPTFTTFFGVVGTQATVVTDTTHLFTAAGLDVDQNDNVYVKESNAIGGTLVYRILKVSPEGYVTTSAANGLFGTGIGIDDFAVIGEDDIFAGISASRIYRITGGSVSNIIGSGVNGYQDGPAATAKLGGGSGSGSVAALAMVSGNIWFADFSAPRIRKVDGAGNVSTLAGDGTTSWANGTGTAAKVGFVYPAAVGLSGNYWFTGGSGSNGYFLAKCTSAGVVTTQIVYTGLTANGLVDVCRGADNNIYALYLSSGGGYSIDKIDVATNTPTVLYSGITGTARGITCDSKGHLYVSFSGTTGSPYNFTIQKISNAVMPVIPNGAPIITVQPYGTSVYVGDSVTLTSAATGVPTPTVQWQKAAGAGPTTGLPSLNGVLAPWAVGTPGLIYPGDDGYPDPLATWTNISGATSPAYTFTAAATGTNRYKAIYTNSSGSTITNAAKVAVSAAPAVGDWNDKFDSSALVPGSDVYSPGQGTPGAVTRTPKNPGQATILALVREFSSSPSPVGHGVGRAIRITGPTTIAMVDPAASNSLLATSADTLYSSASTARAASIKALAVLHGTVTTSASATLTTNDVALLLSGWRIPDRLPVRGIGLRPVKSVQMTFTPDNFTADVTFHVG